MLSDRELASLAWIGLVGLWAVFWAPLRQALRRVAGALLKPVLLIPLALFALYMAGIVGLASLTPAWKFDLLNDTLIWFVTAGVVLFYGAGNAAKESGWFGRKAIDAVKVAVFLECYLNLHTLSFIGEFLLQAWLLVLVLTAAAATSDRSLKGFKVWAGRLQAFTGLALLVYVAVWLAGNWQTIDLSQNARELALPVWLSLFAVPALFAWSWYMTWDGARGQLRRSSPDGRISWRSRLAVLLGYRFGIRDLHRFAHPWSRRVAEAPSLHAALQVVREHRAKLRKERAETRQAADDLKRYAGVEGSDAEGRQLDRREFTETVHSLELVSSAHMGWWRHEPVGRYKPRVADVVAVFARGLPEEHGIVMKVRKDGQAWYAWRRTISGWVLAVGAKGEPPNQWFYDGPQPPRGYPGSDPAWPATPFEQGPNWG